MDLDELEAMEEKLVRLRRHFSRADDVLESIESWDFDDLDELQVDELTRLRLHVDRADDALESIESELYWQRLDVEEESTKKQAQTAEVPKPESDT